MSPIDIEDILERAKNSTRVGDHEEAERLLKRYLAKVPGSRDARLLLGTAYAREGKLSEAADEFIFLLAENPRDVEALNNAAVISRRQGKFIEALNYLMDAIDENPVRAEFHYNIGNIHKQLNNSQAATMAYSKVIELDPGYVPAYNNLGTIYEQLREYEKAYAMFRRGLALDINNPTIHFNYGLALEANGRLEEAANEYRAALRSKPGWLQPMNNLGVVFFKQGRHDKALATFNRILKSDPYNAEAHNNMGVVQTDQGRTREAVRSYRRALEADPRYAKAVVNLERALEDSGDFADAIIELEKLVKLSPDSADIRNRLAGLYLKMERYPEALEQAEAALQWEPNSIQALRIMGASQRIMGNDAAARTSFEKILSIDPGNYNYLLDLADIHFRRKEYKEAEERIELYLIRRPNDRNAKLLLGKLCAEMGNRSHAIQIFEELSKLDPNDTEALTAAAELHREAGSIEKALRTADTLVNVQGKRATADDLTGLNKSLAFYENAVNAYSSSVKEMWNRNIKLLKDGEDEEAVEADIALLMGAAGDPVTIDEETEPLFVEDKETFFSSEEDEGDLFFDDSASWDFPEEAPRSRDPLDALVEPGAVRPRPLPKSPPDTPLPKQEPPEEDSGVLFEEGEEEISGEMSPEEPPEEVPLSEAAPDEEEGLVPLDEDERPGETPEEEIPAMEEILEDELIFADGESLDPSPEEDSGVLFEEGEEEIPGEMSPEEPPGEVPLSEAAPGEDEGLVPLDGDERPGETPEEEIPAMEETLEDELVFADGESLDPSPEEESFPEVPPPENDFTEEPFTAETGAEDAVSQTAAGLEQEEVSSEKLSDSELPEPETEAELSETPLPETKSAAEAAAPDMAAPNGEETPKIDAIVELLILLKDLTAALPKEQQDSFSRDKLPETLESVIDSLKNLVIISKQKEDKTDEASAGRDTHGS